MFCKMLEQRIDEFIEMHGLVEKRSVILVAVSGGPDSVLLASVLSNYINKVSGKLVCCHVNHGLRGEDAERDERFVEEFASAQRWGLVKKHVDVASYRREHRLSIEEAARTLRFRALEQARQEVGAQRIALGHSADDAVETLFLNLLRGTGRKGLSGIEAERGRIIRPLLTVRRAEIIHYLKEKGLKYRVDATNWQCDFTRNFIRHELIPRIEQKLKRQVSSNILQLQSILRSEEALLTQMTDECCMHSCRMKNQDMNLQREDVRNMHPALQRRVIRRCFDEMVEGEKRLNFKEIEAIRKAAMGMMSGATFSHHGVRFLIGSESILITRQAPAQAETPGEMVLDTAAELTFQDRYLIRTTILERLNGDYENRDCVYFDLEKLALPLTVRTRREGDAFIPFGMKQRKKVKELFIDTKIPFWERDRIPVIADTKGILWIAGVRRAAAAAVDGHTKRILKIEKRDCG